ncbi:hypothetical protein [Miltoncostaea oceani]|uniref:hypothetical protein n=1 Tax=Miltoncostaea oceani TaxID=2843216 RepID=UPI001C3C5D39|nr:hypothetical protein [Miltoncostaea oceani]
MRRGVTYQSMLGAPAGSPPGTYARLGDGAITTRRKDARKDITVTVSKSQRRWLREASELSGAGIDEGQIVRALIDLGMQLDIDWAVLASGKALRGAVRESVMVRQRAAE